MGSTQIHFREQCRWRQENGTWVKGHPLGLELSTAVEEIPTQLAKANGFFAIVHQAGGSTVVAVDRVRSLPLYYGTQGDTLYVSDDAYWIKEQVGAEQQDPLAVTEFLLTGYVTGRETVVRGVNQLQAGEALIARESNDGVTFEIVRYYRYLHRPSDRPASADWTETLDSMLVCVFQRLADHAAGRPIVIPLSGGLDSRLIAIMLRRLGYDNVITFSYGRADHPEAQISQDVATRLGFRWIFVPYSSSEWSQWFSSAERHRFYHYADGLSALPHVQDALAVAQLKRERAIPDNSLFVPGHSADLLAGSRSRNTHDLYYGVVDSSQSIGRHILDFHYKLWDWSRNRRQLEPLLLKRILSQLDTLPYGTPEEAVSAFEHWDCLERQAKFVINAVRVYEFWGYEWWLPFWDADFMDYWSMVPLEHRLDKSLYDKHVHDLFVAYGGVTSAEAKVEAKSVVLGKLRTLLAGTFAESIARQAWGRWKRYSAYETNQFQWYGMIGRSDFSRLYTGNQTINSFLTLEWLGASNPNQVGLLSEMTAR